MIPLDTIFGPLGRKIITPLRRELTRFVRDEGGATMTEFVITLPIFVMIFVGISAISRLNVAVVRSGGVAYAQMWDQAIDVQEKQNVGVHTMARNSGSAVKENMRAFRYKQEDSYLEQMVQNESNRHGSGLANKGTLGESDARVHNTQGKVKLNHIHADVSPNITKVVGNSKLGKSIFDDGGSAPLFSSGANALGPGISNAGTAFTAGTGARYGEVTGSEIREVYITGRRFEVGQFYNTLVAPYRVDEQQATKVVRDSMQKFAPYKNLLGIHKDQRLDSASQSVKKIKGAM